MSLRDAKYRDIPPNVGGYGGDFNFGLQNVLRQMGEGTGAVEPGRPDPSVIGNPTPVNYPTAPADATVTPDGRIVGTGADGMGILGTDITWGDAAKGAAAVAGAVNYGDIADAWFGGAESNAANAEQAGLDLASQRLERATETSRGESKQLTGAAKGDINTGFKAGLDLWNQVLPRQMQVQQDGNYGAQEQLYGGLRQAHNALLGNQIDYGAFQPKRLDYEVTTAEYPEFYDATQPLAPAGQAPYEQQNVPPEAHYIRGRLASGEITYQQAMELLTTGAGYGNFTGMPQTLATQFISDWSSP